MELNTDETAPAPLKSRPRAEPRVSMAVPSNTPATTSLTPTISLTTRPKTPGLLTRSTTTVTLSVDPLTFPTTTTTTRKKPYSSSPRSGESKSFLPPEALITFPPMPSAPATLVTYTQDPLAL